MGCFSPNSWRLLVTGVIFFPLPLLLLLPSSWSALRKSQQPLSGEDEPLRTHGGMWSWTEISASRWPSRSSSIRAHMPDALCVYVPFSQSVYFANSGGTNGEKKPWKLPTFSAQRARHSEQHGPDKHQTSRRLHLPLRPAASSPCSKLHRSFTFPTEELAVVSRIVFSFFFFFFWQLCSCCSLPNLSDFLPGICACRLWSVTAGAQEQRRAPVKAWAGSGRLTQPAFTTVSAATVFRPLTARKLVTLQHKWAQSPAFYISVKLKVQYVRV